MCVYFYGSSFWFPHSTPYGAPRACALLLPFITSNAPTHQRPYQIPGRSVPTTLEAIPPYRDKNIQNIQGVGVLLLPLLGLFRFGAGGSDNFLKVVHFLKKSLRGLGCGQSIGRFCLVGAKGIAQQIHAGFHIVVTRIAHFLATAIAISFRALTIDICAFGGNNHYGIDIEKILNSEGSHIALDDILAHNEKLVDGFLHAAVIAPFRNRNCRVFPGSSPAARPGLTCRKSKSSRHCSRDGNSRRGLLDEFSATTAFAFAFAGSMSIIQLRCLLQ